MNLHEQTLKETSKQCRESLIEEKMHRIDQFAAEAMHAILSRENFSWSELPADAYRMALAMESEREKVMEKLKKEVGL